MFLNVLRLKMCYKAINTYPSTIKLVPECSMTQKCVIKQLINVLLYLILFMIDIKLKKRVKAVFLKIFFLIVYYSDKYKTQIMCDKAVDDSPVTFKLTPDWFVISKMIKKFFTALYANENSFYFNEDFDNVVFFCNEICVLNVDPKNINLDNNF